MASIRKRTGKRGVTWQVREDLGYDPLTGKRRQRMKTCRTKREAETTAAAWRLEIERGVAIDPARITVREFFSDWLEGTIRPSARPSTYTSYEMLLRVHILPELGAVPLQRLAPAQLQRLYTAKLTGGRADGKGGGLSTRTVRYLHAILHQGLERARALGAVALNAADRATPPKNVARQLHTWDADEVQSFLEAALDDTYAPIWLLALTTGMRIGELLGLRWCDVDLGAGVLRVRQCAVAVGSKMVLGAPKSKAGRRTIALSPVTVAALKEHRARQTAHRWRIDHAWQDFDLVLASQVGTPINAHQINNRMYLLMERAHLSRIRFHDLRHTHATLLLLSGVNVKVLSERLGHASVRITLDTYAHVLPQMQEQAAATIDAVLFSPQRREVERGG